MNSRLTRDRLPNTLRVLARMTRVLARMTYWRRRGPVFAQDSLPGGIQFRMEAEGLLYIEPRATAIAASGA